MRIPTLVIHGDADPLVPVACGIDVADTVPGAQRLIIEGMGHALPITLWPRIVEAIATHAAQAHRSPLTVPTKGPCLAAKPARGNVPT